MGTYLEDEVDIIKYYRMVKMTRERRDVTLDEATRDFVDRYAAKYEKVWYKGIEQRDLRISLFFGEEEGMKRGRQ